MDLSLRDRRRTLAFSTLTSWLPPYGPQSRMPEKFHVPRLLGRMQHITSVNFWGGFRGKGEAPNGPYSATKCLVFVLVFRRGSVEHGPGPLSDN